MLNIFAPKRSRNQTRRRLHCTGAQSYRRTMKWIVAIFALATTISAGDQNGDQEAAKSMAAMNKKLDDLTKQLSQQKVENEANKQQLHNAISEIDGLKNENMELRKTQAILRDAKKRQAAHPRQKDDIVVATCHLRMVETVFVGGTPGASSEMSNDYAKDLAFKKNPGKDGKWQSAENDPPYYIWYDFKRLLRPAKISYLPYKPYGTNQWTNYGLMPFQFIGTDDPVCAKNSNWTVLCEGESSIFYYQRQRSDERGCTVATKSYRGNFHCLGLRFLVPKIVNANFYGQENYVALRGIRIWEMQWL